jgi:hypothetical protein
MAVELGRHAVEQAEPPTERLPRRIGARLFGPGQGLQPVELLLAAITCGLAVLYVNTFVDRGWIPHDEGLLAQSADRLLAGELPHRDFEDAYTGGLTFLHAASFRLWGVRLLSIRWTLLTAALIFVPALYGVAICAGARRLAPVTVFCCVAWSLPNYFAGLPSWYVLILSVLGTVALLQASGDRSRLWLAAAGMCGGLALLMKVTGLYFVAAGLLFLVYRSQVRSEANESQPRSGVGGMLLVLTVGGVLVSMQLLLIKRDLRPMELLQFVLPTAVLCGCLGVNEWRRGRGRLVPRLAELATDASLFLAGAAVPVLIFVIPFALRGALGDLFHGVLVLPRMRLELAKAPLPPLVAMLPVVLPAVVILPPCLGWRSANPLPRIVFPLVLGGLALLLLAVQASTYYWTFLSLRGLLPVLVCAACGLLLRASPERLGATKRLHLFLLAAVASLLSLTQYPQSYEIYFCYCAPLVLLLLHAISSAIPKQARWTTVGLMGFYLAFGVISLNAGYGITPSNSMRQFSQPLDLDRGGLRVQPDSAQQYQSLVAAIREATPADAYIYAAPDCPEVYFLANRRNPTPTMFDFFDDRPDRAARILRSLDEKQVQVVVINLHPLFSPAVAGELAEGLRQRFPHQREMGRFVVAFRHPPHPRTVPDTRMSLGMLVADP